MFWALWERHYFCWTSSLLYPNRLAEDEKLTMRMATLTHIDVVPHSLIRFDNGELGCGSLCLVVDDGAGDDGVTVSVE
jgi:hypothetical protein